VKGVGSVNDKFMEGAHWTKIVGIDEEVACWIEIVEHIALELFSRQSCGIIAHQQMNVAIKTQKELSTFRSPIKFKV